MNRKFNIGDRIICTTTPVVGKCIKFYVPTASTEQTMVLTDDGRKYHAPTSEWKLYSNAQIRGYDCDEINNQNLLNPYGEYLIKFAHNHGLSIDEAAEQPMIKARKIFFDATGM